MATRHQQRRHRARRRKGRGPRGGTNPLLRQAQLETQIAYGPQVQGLAELMREARGEYQGELRAADVSSAGLIRTIDRARPDLAAGYQRSRDRFGVAQSNIDAGLRGLGASADPFKAAATAEHQAAERDLAESARRADADLVQQRSSAAGGRIYQRTAARDRYQTKMEKYRTSSQNLAGQMAAFTIKALRDLQAAKADADLEKAKLRQDRLKLRQDYQIAVMKEAGADRRAATKEAGANRRAAMMGSGKGGSNLTPIQARGYKSQWRRARAAVQVLTDKGLLKRSNGNAVVYKLSNKGIDEAIARGVVQTYLFGGVRRSLVPTLNSLGLNPRVISGSPGKTVKRVGSKRNYRF